MATSLRLKEAYIQYKHYVQTSIYTIMTDTLCQSWRATVISSIMLRCHHMIHHKPTTYHRQNDICAETKRDSIKYQLS